MCSLTYGQSHILVDYPAPSGAVSLAEERQQNRRPYWIEVDPTNLYGWRLDRESNYGNLIQARIGEKAVLPDGQFGEKVFDQIRVIEPGRYRVFRKKEQIEEMYDVSDNSVTGNFEVGSADKDYRQVESGSFSLGEIPLVTIYSGKTDNLVSKPPLLDIAYLNLARCISTIISYGRL
jgi:hypothetical protein